MQKNNTSLFLFLLVVVCLGIFLSYKKVGRHVSPNYISSKNDIRKLSDEQEVLPYLKKYHKLPNYYITKNKARKKGWVPSKQNLCEVAPGRVIGGDIFRNRERQLPKKEGRVWYEADLNYDCKGRNADRVLFSNDSLIYTTHNHYKTFEKE